MTLSCKCSTGFVTPWGHFIQKARLSSLIRNYHEIIANLTAEVQGMLAVFVFCFRTPEQVRWLLWFQLHCSERPFLFHLTRKPRTTVLKNLLRSLLVLSVIARVQLLGVVWKKGCCNRIQELQPGLRGIREWQSVYLLHTTEERWSELKPHRKIIRAQ